MQFINSTPQPVDRQPTYVRNQPSVRTTSTQPNRAPRIKRITLEEYQAYQAPFQSQGPVPHMQANHEFVHHPFVTTTMHKPHSPPRVVYKKVHGPMTPAPPNIVPQPFINREEHNSLYFKEKLERTSSSITGTNTLAPSNPTNRQSSQSLKSSIVIEHINHPTDDEFKLSTEGPKFYQPVEIKPSDLEDIYSKLSKVQNEVFELRDKNQELLNIMNNQSQTYTSNTGNEHPPNLRFSVQDQVNGKEDPKTYLSGYQSSLNTKSPKMDTKQNSTYNTTIVNDSQAENLKNLEIDNEKLKANVLKYKKKSKEQKIAIQQLKELKINSDKDEEIKASLTLYKEQSEKSLMKLETYADALQADNENFQNENKELRTQIKELFEENQAFRDHFENVSKQNEDRNKDIDLIVQENEALQKEIDNINESSLTIIREKEAQIRSIMLEQQGNFNLKQKELEKMQTAFEKLSNVYEKEKEETITRENEQQNYIESLQEEIKTLEDRFEELMVERDELNDKISQINTKTEQGGEIVVIDEINVNEVETTNPKRKQSETNGAEKSFDNDKISKLISKDMNLEISDAMGGSNVESLENELEFTKEILQKQSYKIEKLDLKLLETSMRLVFSLSEVERLRSKK